MPDAVHINIACSSRAKAGPHAFGICMVTPLGDMLFEHSGLASDATPLHTSYRALLVGLEEAARQGARRVVVYADSEILVHQMRGRLSVRDDRLKELHDKAWLIAARLQFQIIPVPRERNLTAHGLAEKALGVPTEKTTPASPGPRQDNGTPGAPFVPRKHGLQQSAGGMVYKLDASGLAVCLIAKGRVWALPKGRLNEGESPEQTAVREILEETGHLARIEHRLHDIDYWFYWKENNTLYHKTVTFFLMAVLEENHTAPDGEADAVAWFPFAEALQKLTYINEKEVLKKGLARLQPPETPAPLIQPHE